MKASRMAVVLPTIIAIFTIVNFYIGWHVWLFALELWPSMAPAPYWIVFAVVAYSYLLGRLPAPRPLRPPLRLLKVVGSYYFAVLEYAVLLLPLADIAYGLSRLAGMPASASGRFALIAGSVIAAALLVLLAVGSRNAWSPVVRRHTLHVDKSAGSAKSLRVAVASDLHLGNVVGNRHLRRLVSAVNALKPDVILLAGDVLDDSIEPFVRNRMSETMKRLEARDGIYAVLGNHEYYGGDIADYVRRMDEIGIRVLQDETVDIGGAYSIAGRKDRTAESMDPGGRLSVPALLANVDVSRPVILMDHQPHGFGAAAEAGVDLLLSGHTHRGQFAPNHWVTRRLFELDWGYVRKGLMHVVVSSGFGTWGPPIRLASRSEIVAIELQFRS